MSGLRKAKKYDWKDSNLALFGSELERNVKKASAETETAWKGAGQKVGLKIWRVVKFKLETWPHEQYGEFYSGDSYIVLNTYIKPGEDDLEYDVHFWIGKYSTQDEYGTAAYKTVELDTLLDDKPIQHREVQGYESELFKSYFKVMEYLEGGAESGFRHVKPQEYKPRLMHFHGDRTRVEVKQVPLRRDSLKSDDVFILDLGLTAFQWTGAKANKDEKFKAMQFMTDLKGRRFGRMKVEFVEDGDEDEDFNANFDKEEEAEEDEDAAPLKKSTPLLFKLSDESGDMSFDKVAEGGLKTSMLHSEDVFIVDGTNQCFVWIGKDASSMERKQAMTYAHNYLTKTSHPVAPITAIMQGKENADFQRLF